MKRISGMKAIVFGDPHADEEFQGRHINYWENFMEVSDRISKVVEIEKPDIVFIAGDLVGVRRGKSAIKDKNALLYLAKWLKSLPNVVVLRGNHDYNEISDYEFLSELRVFTSSKQTENMVEFTHPNAEVPCFFHLVDYGQENEKIEIQANAYNIGIMHNEFFVAGQEQQFHGEGAIELTSKKNFFGLDMVVSGHIHTPTNGMINFSFQDGFESAFANLGCPTRPGHGELYDQVWYMVWEYQQTEGSNVTDMRFRQEPFALKPYTEIFRPNDDFIEGVQDKELIDDYTGIQKGKLEEILSSLATSNMGNEDFFKQIDNLQVVATPESREVAKQYLEMALNK
ncbi:metallophosphoesterase [Bacillus cereus]|uniref:metallophosphoesterase n=1 Tax=Bacillus cereus TaxID=1396 RepID=UPI003D17E078